MIHILNGGTYIEKEIGKAVEKNDPAARFFGYPGAAFCKESL